MLGFHLVSRRGQVEQRLQGKINQSEKVPDPGLGGLLRINNAYWRSSILHAAVKLGICSALGEDELSAEEVASRCGTDARATEVLLVAMLGLGLVEKRDSRYSNGPTARRYLVQNKPDYLGDLVNFLASMWSNWGRLADVVRSGRCTDEALGPGGRADIERMDDASLRGFILAMHNLAMAQAVNLAKSMDLTGKKRLYDVGGGPGTYAIAACQLNPQLTAVVFDLPRVLLIAKEIIARFGLSDRITTQPGDFTVDSFGGNNDVILLSKVLHQECPDTCLSIFKRAFEALNPGGLIVVHGELLDDERQGPELAAMFGVQTLLSCPQGGVYTHAELKAWMQMAGFTTPEDRWLPGQVSAVIARKPSG